MSDAEFRAFLNLFMSSDPYPGPKEDHGILELLLSIESGKRGFSSWIDAFHSFRVRK